jgi:cytochrome oxidase Cu insertion factor (SCO1/SenC/PrrC family)
MRCSIALGLAIAIIASGTGWAHDPRLHQQGAPPTAGQPSAAVPDVPVLDQDGRQLRFYSDLVRGRTVAIDFIYTSCTTFCLPLTANFRAVQERLAARIGKDLALVSITVDPATDTPERLKAFAAQFDAAPGWSFVTGAKPDIARLLDKLGQPLGNPEDHSPLVLVRNDANGGWAHVDGNDSEAIEDTLVAVGGPAPAAASNESSRAARAYMTNPVLLTQDGRPVHFFDDLLQGKVVAMNFIYTSCKDACPLVSGNLARVQDFLGDRLGSSINLISFTVDPAHDQPIELKRFADAFGARPGWYFLTGEPAVLDPLLHRLGAYSGEPLDHNTALIVGNPDAGVWTKLFAMGDPSAIAHALLNLRSPPTQ